MTIDQPLLEAHGYAKKIARPLARLGIVTVRDLLHHFPVRHEDLRTMIAIRDAVSDTSIVVRGVISDIANRRAFRKRMMVTEAVVTDASGSMRCVWFAQPYLAHAFRAGMSVLLAGKVVEDRYGIHLANPLMEREREGALHVGRLVPIYPLTAGITQKQVRFLMDACLPTAQQCDDPVPERIREREGLCTRANALNDIHFPESDGALTRARERLAFDEVLTHYQCVVASRRELHAHRAVRFPIDKAVIQDVVDRLPFSLTHAQERALEEVSRDLSGGTQTGTHDHSPHVIPMQRLLNGDVGSGKTIVAALAAAQVARAGYQTAYLAPTEVLAVQQANNLVTWLRPSGIRVALWTRVSRMVDGAVMDAKTLRRLVASGDVAVIVGTHALLTSTAQFGTLALAIIDEQHRFGVDQRAALREKGVEHDGVRMLPHLLSMTATPIPRTLALSLLGDLHVSVLDELPPGRSPVTTTVVTPSTRRPLAAAIQAEIDRGHQVFVVCPTIDASDERPGTSVEEVFARAEKAFPNARVGMLHGRQRKQEQQDVMTAFASGAIQILVATTVIEVGIDQPNATIMIIEDADRFGLAQLHQLRGRVGRGTAPGACFLCTSSPTATTRLCHLEQTTDGFRLAEVDLAERGPGAVVGTVQSGWPAFRFASMDTRLLTRARAVADELGGNVAEIPPATVHLE